MTKENADEVKANFVKNMIRRIRDHYQYNNNDEALKEIIKDIDDNGGALNKDEESRLSDYFVYSTK